MVLMVGLQPTSNGLTAPSMPGVGSLFEGVPTLNMIPTLQLSGNVWAFPMHGVWTTAQMRPAAAPITPQQLV